MICKKTQSFIQTQLLTKSTHLQCIEEGVDIWKNTQRKHQQKQYKHEEKNKNNQLLRRQQREKNCYHQGWWLKKKGKFFHLSYHLCGTYFVFVKPSGATKSFDSKRLNHILILCTESLVRFFHNLLCLNPPTSQGASNTVWN